MTERITTVSRIVPVAQIKKLLRVRVVLSRVFYLFFKE